MAMLLCFNIMTITKENVELLNTIKSLTGDPARLAHRLAETSARLEAVIAQAEAQFAAGDRWATFNRQTIEALKKGLKE
jgi:hypothetical protein